VAFGAWLASRGAFAVAGIVLTGLLGLGAAIAATLSSRAGVAYLPEVSSSAIAWGGGVMMAFGASLRALGRDREQGVQALVMARGATLADYVRGRVLGLVLVLASVVGGSTLLACLSAIAVARGAGPVVAASVGSLAYALAFSATLGPVAIAALGARTRTGGYLSLLAVLVLPELLARSGVTAHLLPPGWGELTSIPAALSAVRVGVMHPVLLGAHAARALAALAALVAVALLVVAGRARQKDSDAPA
jgi:hypothetical protein